MAEDSQRENIPIQQLINFNDSILEEYGKEPSLDTSTSKSRLSTSTSSARPKSSKRPKSAKKKKLDWKIILKIRTIE